MSESKRLPMATLVLMASVTFMGMLSELAPSGVLPQMAQGLNSSEAQIGNLIGYYAIASAVCAIPLISATITWNRKKLLMLLLAGFSLSNLVIALSHVYWVTIICRLIGGVCAGVLWPMISAYGMKLVPSDQQGRAIAIIMSGSTLGLSVGMPLITWVGTRFGWHTEFTVMAAVIAGILVLSHFYLPEVKGEKMTRTNSPLTLIRQPAVLIILLLTLLAVVGHYIVYTYITVLVNETQFAGGISMAQILFGIGSLISVYLAATFIDRHLRMFIVTVLGVGSIAMAAFLIFGGTPILAHLAYLLWGLAFGPLVTMYQTAVTRQVETGKDVATSIQSSCFNFSIMIASTIGGAVLSQGGAKMLVTISLVCLASAGIISFLSKKSLA